MNSQTLENRGTCLSPFLVALLALGLSGCVSPTKMLFRSASSGDSVTVGNLLAKGADVHANDERGWTPLHCAANAGHIEVVEQILAEGVDVNTKTGPGLPTYALSGNCVVLKYQTCSTPLHFAAGQGHVSTVELLLARGADPNVKQQDGDTPLHLAANKAYADIAALLLAHGADVNARNKFDDTPLHMRIGVQAPTIRIEKGTGKPFIVFFHDDPILRVHSVTPLFAPVVRVLVANGADVNARNAKGQLPLHSASNLHPDVAQVLLANGADVNAGDKINRTPLHEAADAGLADMTELLLASGAAVNAKTREGLTPLTVAVQAKRAISEKNAKTRAPANHDEVIKLLKEQGGAE